MAELKTLIYDIETAGVNALRSDLGFVIVFGYKWLHEKAAHSIVINKSGLERFDDRSVLVPASKLLQAADIAVTHYGSVFDKRFIQGRLLIHNLPAVEHPKMRDTCMGARSVTNFSSKRLKHIAKILKFKHQKLENNWPDAWFQVMRGNRTALSKLAVYCEGDVLALEEFYVRLRPYIKAWSKGG